ncbi:hypothetical protein [Hyphomonas sp.]|uniref:hypothetical protein n=1 Tax=Hyphomonas sp. TaxID=87 RepID=UPI00391C85F1
MESEMFGQPSLKAITLALREIEAASGGAAASAPRAQLRKVIDLLDNSDASTVQELVAKLASAKKQTPKKKPAKPINTDLVSRYFDRLQAARNAPQDFERTVNDLFADKSARLAHEIRQIANKFTGGSGSYKTKQLARDAIERKYHGRWVADQYRLKAS